MATLYKSGSRLDLGNEARAGRMDRTGASGEEVRGHGKVVFPVGGGEYAGLETGVG